MLSFFSGAFILLPLPVRVVLIACTVSRRERWDIPLALSLSPSPAPSLFLAHAALCVTQIRAWADTRGVGGFLHGIPNTGRFTAHGDTQTAAAAAQTPLISVDVVP